MSDKKKSVSNPFQKTIQKSSGDTPRSPRLTTDTKDSARKELLAILEDDTNNNKNSNTVIALTHNNPSKPDKTPLVLDDVDEDVDQFLKTSVTVNTKPPLKTKTAVETNFTSSITAATNLAISPLKPAKPSSSTSASSPFQLLQNSSPKPYKTEEELAEEYANQHFADILNDDDDDDDDIDVVDEDVSPDYDEQADLFIDNNTNNDDSNNNSNNNNIDSTSTTDNISNNETSISTGGLTNNKAAATATATQATQMTEIDSTSSSTAAVAVAVSMTTAYKIQNTASTAASTKLYTVSNISKLKAKDFDHLMTALNARSGAAKTTTTAATATAAVNNAVKATTTATANKASTAASITPPPVSEYVKAIQSNDISKLLQLEMIQPNSVYELDSEGDTVFHKACQCQQLCPPVTATGATGTSATGSTHASSTNTSGTSSSVSVLQHLGEVVDKSIFSLGFYSHRNNNNTAVTAATTNANTVTGDGDEDSIEKSNREAAMRLLLQAVGKPYNHTTVTAVTTTTTAVDSTNNVTTSNNSDNINTNSNNATDTAATSAATAATAMNSVLLRSGWLHKYKDVHAPKRRWCQLYATHLLYYESPEDIRNGVKPKGSIPLEGCQIRMYAPYTSSSSSSASLSPASGSSSGSAGGSGVNVQNADKSKSSASVSSAPIFKQRPSTINTTPTTITTTTATTTANTIIMTNNVDTKIPTTTFEIIINENKIELKTKKSSFLGGIILGNKQSKTEQMKFQATTELDSLEWITLIKAITANIDIIDINTKHHKLYTNLDARRMILQHGNRNEQSPLHVLATSNVNNDPHITDEDRINIIACIHWFLANGCNPYQTTTTATNDGFTAMELAYNCDNLELMQWISELTKRLDREEELLEKMYFSLLYPPLRFPGFSYVTIHLHKQEFLPTASSSSNAKLEIFEKLILTISMRNHRNQLIEPFQQVAEPYFRRRKCVYWGNCIYMQLPYELITDRSVVEFSLQGIPYGSSFASSSSSSSFAAAVRPSVTTTAAAAGGSMTITPPSLPAGSGSASSSSGSVTSRVAGLSISSSLFRRVSNLERSSSSSSSGGGGSAHFISNNDFTTGSTPLNTYRPSYGCTPTSAGAITGSHSPRSPRLAVHPRAYESKGRYTIELSKFFSGASYHVDFTTAAYPSANSASSSSNSSSINNTNSNKNKNNVTNIAAESSGSSNALESISGTRLHFSVHIVRAFA